VQLEELRRLVAEVQRRQTELTNVEVKSARGGTPQRLYEENKGVRTRKDRMSLRVLTPFSYQGPPRSAACRGRRWCKAARSPNPARRDGTSPPPGTTRRSGCRKSGTSGAVPRPGRAQLLAGGLLGLNPCQSSGGAGLGGFRWCPPRWLV